MKIDLVPGFSAEKAFQCLVDPLCLAVWLDIPYACTGCAPVQIFEIIEWRDPHPWRLRAHLDVIDPGKHLRLELETSNTHASPLMELHFKTAESGEDYLEIPLVPSEFIPLVEKMSLPSNQRRLLQYLMLKWTPDGSRS